MGSMICFEGAEVTFNYRVAAIIRRRDDVLLQTIGDADFWCLPGGRVELLESGEEAMRRELEEELGVPAQIERLVWVVENLYVERARKFHEASLYYAVSLQEDSAEYHAREPWRTVEVDGMPLLFQWHPVSKLEELNLVPAFLRTRLSSLPQGIEYVLNREI